jgi:hypothetical protein
LPLDDKLLPVTFITEESAAAEYRAAVEAQGQVVREESWDVPDDLLDEYGDAQFEPFMILVAAVSVGFLIKRISDVWLDHSRAGGQVIDVRKGTIEVRRAPYLNRGTLVLVTDNEQAVYAPEQHDEALEAIARLAPALG